MMTLGASGIMTGFAVVLFLVVSVSLVLIVLIQRPQGGGLGGAFGSAAGSGQTAFGAKTGDALTIATVVMFLVWLSVAVALVFIARPQTISTTGAPTATGTTSPIGTTDGTGVPLNLQKIDESQLDGSGLDTPDDAGTDGGAVEPIGPLPEDSAVPDAAPPESEQ